MNKQTQKRNAAFNAATKAERAVMTAKDALKMLSAGKTTATTGVWVGIYGSYPVDDKSLREKQICDISDGFKECRVCALGSLMLSEIRHTNKLTVGEVGDEIHYQDYGARLNKIFSKSQQKLMELAFEGGYGYFDAHDCVSEKVQEKIEDFYQKYPNETDRLRAILKNVVKNGGKFVLPPA